MSQNFPSQTHAVIIHEYRPGLDHVAVETRDVPPPAEGEVLVRVAASPLNPSDLAFVQGNYVRKHLPAICGFEAGGTVIAAGNGVDPSLVGRTVACFAGDDEGAWTEILRTSATSCFPVPDGITAEAAATMLVNPLTAWALLDRAGDSPAIAQTAAASALGQMIARLAIQRGIPAVHIVRRDEQAETLRALGAEYVLNSESASFDHDFRSLSRKLDVRVCFDAVAGPLADRIFQQLPSRSKLIVYGGLGGGAVQATVGDLLFKDKAIEGFWLPLWMRDTRKVVKAWAAVRGDLGSYKTEVRARYPLERVKEALADYAAQMTGGKVLLTP